MSFDFLNSLFFKKMSNPPPNIVSTNKNHVNSIVLCITAEFVVKSQWDW